jgi:hypothetical protein
VRLWRRNPRALSVVTMEKLQKIGCHFPWNSFVRVIKKYGDVSSLSDAPAL